MKKQNLAFLFIFIILVYLFIFPSPIKKEINFEYQWARPLSNINQDKIIDPVSFRIGNKFGYVSPNGNSMNVGDIRYGVALQDDGYINYDSVSKILIKNSVSGDFLYRIDSKGYPYSLNNRLFLISTNRTVLSEWDDSGEKLWRNVFPSIVTSMDCNNDNLVVGFLDGNIKLYNLNGEEYFSFDNKGSKISVVYGVSISKKSKYIALVSGINPQKFTILEKKEEIYKTIKELEVEDSLRRNLRVKFLLNDQVVVFEKKDELVFYNIENNKIISVKLDGMLYSISENIEHNLIFYTLKKDKKNIIFCLDPRSSYVNVIDVQEAESSFISNENELYIGFGNNISKFIFKEL